MESFSTCSSVPKFMSSLKDDASEIKQFVMNSWLWVFWVPKRFFYNNNRAEQFESGFQKQINVEEKEERKWKGEREQVKGFYKRRKREKDREREMRVEKWKRQVIEARYIERIFNKKKSDWLSRIHLNFY